MSTPINDNLRIRAPKLTDERSGPYASIAEALLKINVNERKEGLVIIIIDDTGQSEYWFYGGTSNDHLIKKTTAGGAEGGFEYIEINDNDEIHVDGLSSIQKVILDVEESFIDGMSRNPGDSGILIIQQDDIADRKYYLKDNGGNLGNIYIRNHLPRAVVTLDWYRDDRFCYWRIRDTVAGIYHTTKPVFRVDDVADTLELYHSLPNSELEISTNGGAWQTYTGPINVGSVDRPEGYWRARVKDSPERTPSPIAYSLPFNSALTGFPYIFNFNLS